MQTHFLPLPEALSNESSLTSRLFNASGFNNRL